MSTSRCTARPDRVSCTTSRRDHEIGERVDGAVACSVVRSTSRSARTALRHALADTDAAITIFSRNATRSAVARRHREQRRERHGLSQGRRIRQPDGHALGGEKRQQSAVVFDRNTATAR
jgi:hypothetical protein